MTLCSLNRTFAKIVYNRCADALLCHPANLMSVREWCFVTRNGTELSNLRGGAERGVRGSTTKTAIFLNIEDIHGFVEISYSVLR